MQKLHRKGEKRAVSMSADHSSGGDLGSMKKRHDDCVVPGAEQVSAFDIGTAGYGVGVNGDLGTPHRQVKCLNSANQKPGRKFRQERAFELHFPDSSVSDLAAG